MLLLSGVGSEDGNEVVLSSVGVGVESVLTSQPFSEVFSFVSSAAA